MWINITKQIFEEAKFKSLNYLYQILSWCPTGSAVSIRYNIVVDTEQVEHTANFKKLSAIENSLKEFLDIEFAYFETCKANIAYKIAKKKAKNHFKIEEAILFFNQPVSIILENNKNDSQFIQAIIKYFGTVDGANKAEEYLRNGWLQFENAGGCTNIPNFTEGLLERFKKIAAKNNRSTSDYFRGIIIIDSDKEYESQKSNHGGMLDKLLGLVGENNDAKKKESIGDKIIRLKNKNLNIHILKKRMMENYLPKEVFEDIARQPAVEQNTDLKEWLEVYLDLTDPQLDYINIADGFPPKDKTDNNGLRKSVNEEILILYSYNKYGNFKKLTVQDEKFKKLDKGFNFQGFDENGNLKTGSSFKTEFPNLFRKSIVTKQALEKRDGEDKELQEIVDKITNFL